MMTFDKIEDLSAELVSGKINTADYLDALVTLLKYLKEKEDIIELAARIRRPLWE